MDKRAGLYIVVEGNDGTGKSTQVALLADEYLRGGGTRSVSSRSRGVMILKSQHLQPMNCDD